jgi:sulfate adenylyltransferase subunit 1 (EFTu-like GTPase family)
VAARIALQRAHLIVEDLLGVVKELAYRFFSTERRSFIVADTPGHVQYTRNMATGASTAEVAGLELGDDRLEPVLRPADQVHLVDGEHDAADAEHRGITIDVAYRFFSTERRSFIVADTPGHVQYTRNMGSPRTGLATSRSGPSC